jgi:site-specific DNA-methyltransferase (adenine-specific)
MDAMEIRVENRDCLDLLRELPSGSIDLLLQDPPYGVTQNKWDKEPPLSILWEEWERVIKDNGAMIFFSQQPFTSKLVNSRLDLFRYDLIWYKPLGSGFLNAHRMPLRNHEHLLIFYKNPPVYNPQMGVGIRKKGIRKHNRTGANYGKFATQEAAEHFDDGGKRFPQSIIEVSNGNRTKESFHPTQKPLNLMRYLIRTYSNEGELVFDGYVGSGTTAEACQIERRNFIGCEMNPEYYSYAIQRVEERKRLNRLF